MHCLRVFKESRSTHCARHRLPFVPSSTPDLGGKLHGFIAWFPPSNAVKLRVPAEYARASALAITTNTRTSEAHGIQY